LRPPTPPTLLPYTTLFRSSRSTSFIHYNINRIILFFLQIRIIFVFMSITIFYLDIWDILWNKMLHNFFYGVQQTSRIPPDINNKRSEEHTSELQSRFDLVCRLLLEK